MNAVLNVELWSPPLTESSNAVIHCEAALKPGQDCWLGGEYAVFTSEPVDVLLLVLIKCVKENFIGSGAAPAFIAENSLRIISS